jgi:hypothetical protein
MHLHEVVTYRWRKSFDCEFHHAIIMGYIIIMYVSAMSGGLYYAWSVSQLASTILLILITIGFAAVCIYCAPDTQLMVSIITRLPTATHSFINNSLTTCYRCYGTSAQRSKNCMNLPRALSQLSFPTSEAVDSSRLNIDCSELKFASRLICSAVGLSGLLMHTIHCPRWLI